MKKFIRTLLWKIIGKDPRLEENIELVSPRQQMIDYAVALIDHHTRLFRNQKKVGESGSLLGDYLEFGCYQGSSFIYAYRRAAKLMPWMRFFAFDSFQGLPELKGTDVEGPFWKGQFSCSQKDFMDNLKKAKVDLNRVICVPGWFDDTLKPELKKENDLTIASIIYIDCDIYESCVPVLNFITDIIETGSIIMFDDWLSFKGDPQQGVQKACSEWLAENPQISLQDWYYFGAYGKSFIAKVK